MEVRDSTQAYDDTAWAPIAVVLALLVVALLAGYFLRYSPTAMQNTTKSKPASVSVNPAAAPEQKSISSIEKSFDEADKAVAQMQDTAKKLAVMEAQQPRVNELLKQLDSAAARAKHADQEKQAALAEMNRIDAEMEKLAKVAGVVTSQPAKP